MQSDKYILKLKENSVAIMRVDDPGNVGSGFL